MTKFITFKTHILCQLLNWRLLCFFINPEIQVCYAENQSCNFLNVPCRGQTLACHQRTTNNFVEGSKTRPGTKRSKEIRSKPDYVCLPITRNSKGDQAFMKEGKLGQIQPGTLLGSQNHGLLWVHKVWGAAP